MILKKQYIVRFFFFCELILFFGLYFLSPHGYNIIVNLKKENYALVESIKQEKQNIARLTEELILWNTTSIKKEKIARQELQMARPQDRVYFL